MKHRLRLTCDVVLAILACMAIGIVLAATMPIPTVVAQTITPPTMRGEENLSQQVGRLQAWRDSTDQMLNAKALRDNQIFDALQQDTAKIPVIQSELRAGNERLDDLLWWIRSISIAVIVQLLYIAFSIIKGVLTKPDPCSFEGCTYRPDRLHGPHVKK